MSEHNSTRILALIDDIKRYAAANIRPGLDVRVTAYPVVYSNVVDSLARGQVKSLAFTFLGLLIATSLYFRSARIGLVAMLPNVLPILITMGLMGFLGISLNVGTAMTAAIAIGLAMDDTTHFFARFQEERRKRGSCQDAVQRTMRAIGEPMIHSSILMTAGYLSIALSQFRLSVLFALLCANTIVVALLSDLFVTPWVLLTWPKAFSGYRRQPERFGEEKMKGAVKCEA
jgi:predicted RND superfamily exporter protein